MSSRFYPYATDSNEREVLAYYFAGLSVLFVYLASVGVEAFKLHMPWWIALPTPMAIYLALRSTFSKHVWRWDILHRCGVVKIPNVSGEYEGHLWTSHDDHAEQHPCEFTISQTWTSICIRGHFPQSRSYNMVSGISVEGTDAPRLTYEYWNEPVSGAPTSMVPHRGTVWFDIKRVAGGTELDGEYYTGRGRATFGRIKIKSKARG